jgi:3-deoxy-D-manno-octulosonic-acid transferase
VCAVTDGDAKRFRELGVPPGALRVTGDPGIDSAASRAGSADRGAAYLRPFREEPRPTLVAGSTWPSDLRVLLPALDAARRTVPALRIIVAPHEPSPDRVRALLSELSGRGWRARSLAEVEVGGAAGVDAVVVDRVGVLAHLYTVGEAAYVGGGFHGSGLHSVLEPAAAGLPVIFGPRHANAGAAGELLAAGGARKVRGPGDLAEALASWLAGGVARDYAARQAFGYIDDHLGAAARTAALLDGLT